MPDNKRISELGTAATLDGTDLLEIAQVNAGSSSGYASAKTTLTALANKIAKGIQFGDLQTTAKDLIDAINEAAISGGNSNIADDYDNTQTYVVGDYCIYEGDLYRCITAVTVAESFDSTKWTAVLVTDELGQGGTTVVANPSGAATDDLEKIQIGNTIYEIVGGGISGKKDLLWEYLNSYDITLTHPITDYDFLIFEGNNYSDTDHKGGAIISSTELEDIIGVSGKFYTFNGAIGVFANYTVDSTTSLTYIEGGAKVLRVWGIKLGGGSSWTDVTGTLTAGNTSITLSDNSILTTSTIDIYTDKFGINPTNVTISTGSITLTFEAQSSNLEIKVRVS